MSHFPLTQQIYDTTRCEQGQIGFYESVFYSKIVVAVAIDGWVYVVVIRLQKNNRRRNSSVERYDKRAQRKLND